MSFEMPPSRKNPVATAMVVAGMLALVPFIAFGCGNSDDRSLAVRADDSPVIPAVSTEPSPAATAVPDAGPAEGPAAPKTVIPENVSFSDGEAAYRSGDYQLAAAIFTAYTEGKPDNAWGYYMLGLSSRQAGDPEAAIGSFERALDLDPNHVKSRYNLARALLDVGDPSEALLQADEGLRRDSSLGDGLRIRGRALAELDRTEEALEAYRLALVQDDRDAWSMNNMGLILIGDSRPEEAIAPLARAAELRDDLAVVRNNLGMALELSGYWGTAAEVYADALRLDPRYSKAEANLARVQGRVDSPSVPPIELDLAAAEFVESIETWRSPGGAGTDEVAVPQDSTTPSTGVPTTDDAAGPDTVSAFGEFPRW